MAAGLRGGSKGTETRGSLDDWGCEDADKGEGDEAVVAERLVGRGGFGARLGENVAMREALSPRARTLVADKAGMMPRNGREASVIANAFLHLLTRYDQSHH